MDDAMAHDLKASLTAFVVDLQTHIHAAGGLDEETKTDIMEGLAEIRGKLHRRRKEQQQQQRMEQIMNLCEILSFPEKVKQKLAEVLPQKTVEVQNHYLGLLENEFHKHLSCIGDGLG